MAWMVLEEMLEQSDSDADADGLVAAVSVRSLAASLGVAKDTVHRATGRLRDLGVIEAHQTRTSSGGFAAGGYRLSIPAACLSIVNASSPSPSASTAKTSRRRAPAASRASDQLSLVFES
jgi:DNA-binding transcriptional MocR family regulator